MSKKTDSVRLVAPSVRYMDEFLEAVQRSRRFHRERVSPPRSPDAFRAYLAKMRKPTHCGHFVIAPSGDLVGVINLNEIVRGAFHSAYLGYYAFVPHNGRGQMSAGFALALARAFRELKLHRLEANIQPTNDESLRFIARHGFSREGFSPRYLRIFGKWRDHERWALLKEHWRAAGPRS